MIEYSAAREERALAASRLAASAIFFVGGAGLTVWATFIPLLKVRAGLDDAQIGMVLLCVSLGCLCGMPAAGVLRPRLGPIRSGALAGIAFAAAICAPGLGWSMPLLAGAAYLIGLSFGFLDVCINAHVSALERELGRPIMSSAHAFFSIGNVSGALIGGVLIGAGLGIPAGLGIASLLLIAIAAIASSWLWLPEAHVREAHSTSVFQLPSRTIIGLGVLTVLAFIVELALIDWGALYLVQVTGSPPAQAAYGVAAFSLAMAIGRFRGDRIVHRYGEVATIRVSAVIAIIGIAAIVLAPTALIALPGFAVAGFGIANMVPILFSLSGRMPGVAPTAGIAMTVTIAYGGGLFGPPLVGFVAHTQGMRAAFVMLIGGALVITALVRWIIPRNLRQ
ncbi:MFS transporter [Ancylobacter mangrovi]|uniref:MFS transporter n=1 Tax=Ancylobacter mangrovi TaxID=2972472 RepID=UPI002163B080|nr:MFS transporter [Ancylobacter mangrovi]MCS0502825.1 MFS transporter [Ancylobacter mangrovi]